MKLLSFRILAISTFILDPGMSTRRCFAPQALRMRVNMSAIGSVMLIVFRFLVLEYRTELSSTHRRFSVYQLALRTPGISPESASSRKHMRHTPNVLRNARDRPQ